MALPPHLQQAVSSNQGRANQQLREEIRKLKEENQELKATNEDTMRALMQQKFGGYTDQMRQIREQLAAKDAQLTDKAAELEEEHERNMKYQLLLQAREEKISQQAAEIAKQASGLKESGGKQQDQVLLIQRLKGTIDQQTDALEQSNATIKQLTLDNTCLQTTREELRKSLTQEMLGRLGKFLGAAPSTQSDADNTSGQQDDQSQSDPPDQAVLLDGPQQDQVKEQLNQVERNHRVLEDPDEKPVELMSSAEAFRLYGDDLEYVS
ncbi:hypothetical protein PG993_000968 [Apiospora rasikravindrae]|uniref:Uncharacterized protein n=1 Tax=Apiospora rasikravindrae TaxID=990691 RepID=A0ABR1UA29_9PEZI